MDITEFLSNIRIALDLSNFTIAIIAIMFAVILGFMKLFNYIVNRIDAKDDKQFEVLYKIIEDRNFFVSLNNQPYLIKQLFYKRFYSLKDYDVGEVEFLMSQNNLKISLNQLTNLKSGHIIEFENDRYVKTVDKITYYWSNNYRRSNLLIVIGFAVYIVISTLFCNIFLDSITLFYISIIPLLMLETYLLIKVEVVQSYLRSQAYLDGFITQSIEYRDNHDI